MTHTKLHKTHFLYVGIFNPLALAAAGHPLILVVLGTLLDVKHHKMK
jgi:hypothetical protein